MFSPTYVHPNAQMKCGGCVLASLFCCAAAVASSASLHRPLCSSSMMHVIHSLLSGAWAVRAPAPAVCSSGTTLPGQGFWRAWAPVGPRRPCGPTAQVPLRTGITATETVRKRVATYPRPHSHPHTRRITRSHRTSSVPTYPCTHIPAYPLHPHTRGPPCRPTRSCAHPHTPTYPCSSAPFSPTHYYVPSTHEPAHTPCRFHMV